MKHKFTMPTPERCIALGIKHEGLYSRTQMWFMGVASALSWVTNVHTGLTFPKGAFILETNSATVLNNVKDRLAEYGFTHETTT